MAFLRQQELLAIYTIIKRFSLRISRNYKSIRKGQINGESIWSYNSQKRKPNGPGTQQMRHIVSDENNANKTIKEIAPTAKIKKEKSEFTKRRGNVVCGQERQTGPTPCPAIQPELTTELGSVGGVLRHDCTSWAITVMPWAASSAF